MNLKRLFPPIKSTIPVFSALLLIPGIFIINYFYLKSSEEVYQRALSENSMPLIANAIESSMEEINSHYTLVARLFAASFDRSLISRDRENPEDIREYLRAWSSILDVKNIGVVSLKSNRYYDLENTMDLDYDSPRDSWVQDFLNGKNDYRYSLYDPEDEYSPLYSFFHDFKIRDKEGMVIGLTGLGLSYEKFYQRVKNLHQGIDISFLDNDGDFRVPLSKQNQDLKTLYNLDASSVLKNGRNEDYTAWVSRQDSGARSLLLIRYLPKIHRFLLIEMDVTTLIKNFRRQNLLSYLAIVLLSLLVVLITLVFNFISSRHLSEKAYKDSLTGCFNREYLENKLLNRSGSSGRVHFPILILFDIDNFKSINDERGHKEGDRILKSVSRIVGRQLRGDDVLIRWGGDEFLLLLYADADGGMRFSERILKSTEKELGVTLSIGITRVCSQEKFTRAFERADQAMYEAKSQGRNTVFFKDSDL